MILKLPSIGVTCGTPHELTTLAVVNVGTAVNVDGAIVVNEVVDGKVGTLVLVLPLVVDNVGNNVDIKPVVVPVNAM